MHHIILEKINIIRTIKLNLQLNDEAYKVLVEKVNENPDHDNVALYYWMRSETCSNIIIIKFGGHLIIVCLELN